MSIPRQPPNWCDVFILIEDIADLRARIEKLETPSTGTSRADLEAACKQRDETVMEMVELRAKRDDLERENAELRAQLAALHSLLVRCTGCDGDGVVEHPEGGGDCCEVCGGYGETIASRLIPATIEGGDRETGDRETARLLILAQTDPSGYAVGERCLVILPAKPVSKTP